jgi:hypothetical protein
MAGHPARDRSVRSAASQSVRATYEISRRSSSTAVTSATSITAKFLSSHSKIMRWHHDNAPDASKSLPQMGLSPKRRDCESSGWPLLKFSVHTGCTCHTALGERPALRTCAGLLIHRRHEPAQQFAAATRTYANRYRSGLSANTAPREGVGPEMKFRRPDFLRGASCSRENVERNRSSRSAARRTGQQDDWYADYIVHAHAGKRLTS